MVNVKKAIISESNHSQSDKKGQEIKMMWDHPIFPIVFPVIISPCGAFPNSSLDCPEARSQWTTDKCLFSNPKLCPFWAVFGHFRTLKVLLGHWRTYMSSFRVQFGQKCWVGSEIHGWVVREIAITLRLSGWMQELDQTNPKSNFSTIYFPKIKIFSSFSPFFPFIVFADMYDF